MEKPEVVCIVGVGLIGGSIGLALRRLKEARRIVGIGRDLGRLKEALDRRAVDEITDDLPRGVSNADVIVVCTPVDRIARDVVRASEFAPESALITDAGSTKVRIVAEIERHPGALARFSAAHPIAGSEKQGVAHSRADLFQGRTCAIVSTPRTPSHRIEQARRFWSNLGSELIETDPESHDAMLAYTSHLPHALASAAAGIVPPEWLCLAAGAYRDVTRVAGADADLWTKIFLENRGPLLDALSSFSERMESFRSALEGSDAQTLNRLWDEAKRRREAFREVTEAAQRKVAVDEASV